MKKILCSRIFLVIICGIIFTSLGVYAANNFLAEEIDYEPEDSAEVMNVKEALDDLYDRANNKGKCTNDNVATPVIVSNSNMIPVKIEDDGTVKYADVTKNWYDYCNKEWANAVILTKATSYKVGDVIPESNIQSYFVWIPRYRYKLFNVDNTSVITGDLPSMVQEIEIEFETKDVPASNGSHNGEWLTHPAFTSFDSNGIWVGKFGTGYKGATSESGAQKNTNEPAKVVIKPNEYTWEGITVKNIFLTSYNYKRDLDSHMMKNTEWGAVAYLSHSKYGINGPINTSCSRVTGCGVTREQQTQYVTQYQYHSYNTEKGYLTSTTGNISGVYDMGTGKSEYMAGYIDGNFGASGLKPTSYDTKYFDVYNSNSSSSYKDNDYKYRILGDATGEMGPFTNNGGFNFDSWYNNLSEFVYASCPWFIRGRGNNGGQFSFFYSDGSKDYLGFIHGFRIVLTP